MKVSNAPNRTKLYYDKYGDLNLPPWPMVDGRYDYENVVSYVREDVLEEWARKNLDATAYLQLKNKLKEMSL